jgi:hypothetical protein
VTTANRPTFAIVLRPEPYCLDPIRALRAVLKRALRDHGLRCIGVAERLSVTSASSVAIAGDVALVELASFTAPSLVVDPAAGSFVVMHAAHQLGREFIGCDLAFPEKVAITGTNVS